MITQLVLCKIFCIKACSYYQIIRLIRVASGNITCVLSWDTLNASGIFLDDTFHALQRCPVSWDFKVCEHLTIILRNRAEYHLILSRRGRRPSWLNQGIFRKIEQDNCFIIQQILIDYHFHNEKNYGSMMKTLKASNT